jgi:lincosamide nucleotidyltransferase A/C/D/E
MTSADVIELYTAFQALGVTVWIDGGWGVDALLGVQTRPHSDLDIAVQEKDAQKLRELLEARGFRDVPRDETSRWNFVLVLKEASSLQGRGGRGREITGRRGGGEARED